MDEGIKVSRRTFLGAAGGVWFAIALPSFGQSNSAARAAASELRPSAWVRLLPDDTVVIYSGVSELGQGTMTSLPLALAEELDADWSKVRIEMSPVDESLYGNPKMGNLMVTIGSFAIAGYFTAVRIAGAKARRSLMLAAAGIWNVPDAEISTAPGMLIHQPGNRTMTFGELASKVQQLPAPPDIKEEDLKPFSAFRLIGRNVPRHDIPAKVDGSAEYAINVNLPGLVCATVVRAPVLGATVEQFRARSPLPRGVQARQFAPDAVALVGASAGSVLGARQLLEVTWSKAGTPADGYDDATAHPGYVQAARDTKQVTRVWDKKGDAGAAAGSGGREIVREYASDYFYHAQIEPLNAVCSVTADGKQAEVWAGTQAPAYAVGAVARALDIPKTAVVLHRAYSGGAFGRRAAYDQDYVVDAALLSRDLRKPVKVIWSRDEDVRVGRFKPMTAQWLKAAISPEGAVTAWHHRVACEDPLIMADPPRYKARNESPAIAMLGTNIPSYGVPNQLIEFARQPIVVRIAPMRGVGAPVNRFAVECFVDEIAAELQVDPMEMRKRLLRDSPRGLKVLERVAAMSGWGSAAEGRAKGLSYSDYGGSFLAAVAEVSCDRATGVIRVHRFWAAIDPGLAIQPDTIVSSIEGGLIFGTSMAIKESISFKAGRNRQSNFFDYPILRMAESPDIEVELVASNDRPPAGIAEAAPIVAPAAIANAFATLTGRRVRRMPLSPDRVLSAIRT